VGGGRVPTWQRVARWQPDGRLADLWQSAGLGFEIGAPRALVLSLRGTVDEIGMGRLERVLRKSGGFTFDGNYDGVTVRQLQDAIEFAELPPTYRLALVNAEGREVS
jgi:hypothetical protein